MTDPTATTTAALSHCPDCGYCLTGLPPIHTCPECGFEYDPHTAVVRLSYSEIWMALYLVGWSGLFCSLAALRSSSPYLHLWMWARTVAGLLIITGTVGWLVTHFRKPHCLLISRAGYRFKHPKLSKKLFGWHDFRYAMHLPLSGALRIRTASQRAIKIPAIRIGGRKVTRECAQELNRLAKIYRLNRQEGRIAGQ